MKLDSLQIQEIRSDNLIEYKNFLTIGLLEDEENFRITPDDDLHAPFPTKDTANSFTLGAFVNNVLQE